MHLESRSTFFSSISGHEPVVEKDVGMIHVGNRRKKRGDGEFECGGREREWGGQRGWVRWLDIASLSPPYNRETNKITVQLDHKS